MIYEEFKRSLKGTGLTLVEFAALMGMHRQAITNYGQVGSVPNHLAVIVKLMVALVDAGGDPRLVLGGVELKRKRGRGAGFERVDDK